MESLGQRTDETTLLCDTLTVDTCLREVQREHMNPECLKRMTASLEKFNDERKKQATNAVREQLSFIEGKVSSSDWGSTSIAYGFHDLFERLKDHPDRDLVNEMSKLDRIIREQFEGVFEAVDFLKPILKAKEFIIQYAATRLDTGDDNLCSKFSRMLEFLPEAVDYFVGLLQQSHSDVMVLDKEKELAIFDTWKERYTGLIKELGISEDLLQRNGLNDVFGEMKCMYAQLKEIKDSNLLGDSDVNLMRSRPDSGWSSQLDRYKYEIRTLKSKYQSLWQEAKKSPQQTSATIMREAIKTCKELDRLDPSTCSMDTLDRYGDKLGNLQDLNRSMLNEDSEKHFSVAQESKELSIMYDSCLRESSFAPVNNLPSTFAESGWMNTNPMNDLEKCLTEELERPEDTEKFLEQLMSWMQSCQHQALSKKAAEIIRCYKKAEDPKEKSKRVTELSQLDVFSDKLELQLAFEASKQEIHDVLIHAAVDELISMKAKHLLGPYRELLRAWRAEDIKNGIIGLLDMCSGKKLTVLQAISTFEKLREHAAKLRTRLASHSSMASANFSFLCPELTEDDVAVIFSFNRSVAHDCITHQPRKSACLDVDGSGGLLARHALLTDRGTKAQIFRDFAEKMNTAVEALKDGKWDSFLGCIEDQDKQPIVREIVIAFQFVWLSVWLSRTKFVQFVKEIRLSSKEEVQKRAADLDAGWSTRLQNQRRLEERIIQYQRYPMSETMFSQHCQADAIRSLQELDDTKKDLRNLQIKIEENKNAIDRRKMDLCADLSSRFQGLATKGLDLCESMLGTDLPELHEMLNGETAANQEAVGEVCKEVGRQANDFLKDHPSPEGSVENKLNGWIKKLEDFCTKDLCSLEKGDPVREAIQDVCTLLSIGNERILYLLRTASSLEFSKNQNSPHQDSKKLREKWETLREACTGPAANDGGIRELCVDLLEDESKYREWKERCIGKPDAFASAAYTQNLILSTVSLCCSKIDSIEKTDLYTMKLLPRVQEAKKEGHFQPLPLNDAPELRRVFESVQCIWHNWFLSTERTVDEFLADPFELLWNIETFLTKYGHLYASVSYTSRLFIQGMRDMVKKINNFRMFSCSGQEKEKELLLKVKDVLLEACRQRPLSLQINEMQDVFKELKEQFSELTEVMLRHRQRPGPFLVEFLTRALDHWWFESAECCMRSLRESKRDVDPVASNCEKDESGAGSITRLPLEQFLQPLHLQKEPPNVKGEGSAGLSSLNDRELMDRLHAISLLVNQLPASAGQKLFEWWKTCSVLQSSRTLIEKSVVFLNAHSQLMKQPAELVLQPENDNKEGTVGVLDEACAILRCLYAGIHKDMFIYSAKIGEDVDDLRKNVKHLTEKFEELYTTCEKGFDELIENQPLMRHLMVEDTGWQMQERLSTAFFDDDNLTLSTEQMFDCYQQAWRLYGPQSKNLPDRLRFENLDAFVAMSSYLEMLMKRRPKQQKAQRVQREQRGQTSRQQRVNMTDAPLDYGPLRRKVVKITLSILSIGITNPGTFFQIYADENGVTAGNVHHVSLQTYSAENKEISYDVNDDESFRLTVVYNERRKEYRKRYTMRELESDYTNLECKPMEYHGPSITFSIDTKAIYVSLEASETGYEPSSRGGILDYTNRMRCLAENFEREEHRRSLEDVPEYGYRDRYALRQLPPSRQVEEMQWYHQARKQFHQVEEWRSAIRNFNKANEVLVHDRFKIEQAAGALAKAVAKRSQFSTWRMSTRESSCPSTSSSKKGWSPKVQEAFEEIQSIVIKMEVFSRRAVQNSYLDEFCRSCLDCLRSPTERRLDLFDTKQLELISRMKQSCLLHGEKDLIEFKTSNWLKAVKALAQAQVQWSGCFSDLVKRKRELGTCRNHTPKYLSQTNLSNIPKIVIIHSESRGLILSDARKEIDFGTLLHAKDLSKKHGQTRVYTMEIVNRSSFNLQIQITPEDSNAACFLLRATENIQLAGEASKNLEFALKDSAHGEIRETWCITSGDKELDATFVLKVNIQRLAIQLSMSKINFGVVRTASEAQKRSVSVKNMTTLPVLVKSQIQHMRITSSLSLEESRMTLQAGNERPFTVWLKSGLKEESVETFLVIGAMQNYRYLPLTVQIKKPHFELFDNRHRKIDDTWYLSDIKVRRTARRAFQIKNVGQVPVVFELRTDSRNVKLSFSRGTVDVGKTYPVKLSISHDKEGQHTEELKIFVEGAASRGLRINASWQDPTPSFEKQKVVFSVDPKKLASIVRESEDGKELCLTAANTLVHKQIAVTVYPPKSEYFHFDQEEYYLEKGSEQEFQMTWKVKQLKESEHRIVFVTETGKEMSFVVCLQPPADFAFDVTAQDWQLIQNWKPRNAPMLSFNVATDSPFSIVTTKPSSVCCETATLLNSQSRTHHERGPWDFGSEDIPSEFRPTNNRQNGLNIRLKVGDRPGWIAENVLVESRDKVFLHENPAKCKFLQRKIAIVGCVSGPYSKFELWKAKGDGSIDQHAGSADFHSSLPRILPIARLLCQQRQSASEHMALLQMLCELEMLGCHWALTGEVVKQILDQTVESAVKLCDEKLTAARSGSGKRCLSSLTWRFSDLMKAYLSDKGTALHGSFVKVVEEMHVDEERQALAQAIYVVMHATCPEEQQWNAAVALLRANLLDTASSFLMDTACDQIYSAFQNDSLTFAGCVEWLKSMPLADDNPLAACVLLDGILAVCQGSSGGEEKLSHAIELCLYPIHLKSCFANAVRSDTSAKEEMLIQLIEADRRDILNKTCSNDGWDVLHGFCRISLKCNPQPSTNCLALHLIEMLSKEDVKNSEFFKSDCDIGLLKQTARSLLQTCGMSNILTPLWQLHGSLDLYRQRFSFIREIVSSAFFAVLQQKCEMDNATMMSLKTQAYKEEMGVSLEHDGYSATTSRHVHSSSNPARSLNRVQEWRAADAMPRETMMQDVKEMDSEIESKIFYWFDYLKDITSPEIDKKRFDQEEKRQSIDESLKDLQTALIALRLAQFQSKTHPWILLARIYQFASTLNGEGEGHMIVNALSSFPSRLSKENVISLCRSLVDAGPKSDSLRQILTAIDRGRTAKGIVSIKVDMLRILYSQNIIDTMLATIGQFVETGEVEILDYVYEVLDCDPERRSAFDCLGAVIRAKNAICSQGPVEEGSLDGAQKIENLTKAVGDLGEWGQHRKRSQCVLSIFFNLYAFALSKKNNSPTASAVSKIALLTSLFRFYNGPWKEKDSVAIPDSNALRFEKTDPPKTQDVDDNTEIDNLSDMRSGELGGGVHNPSENAVEEEEANKQCWLLDDVQSPSGTERDQGNKPSERPPRRVSPKDETPPEADGGQSISEQLEEVENVMKDIHKSIESGAEKLSSMEGCRVLKFENVIDFLVKLKKAAIMWTLLFEASVCKSRYAANSEVDSLQGAILCSGIDVVSVFCFLQQHLESCSLFTMPSAFTTMQDSVLVYLNIIPREGLHKMSRKLLQECGSTVVVKENTTDDFIMPSIYRHMGRQGNYGGWMDNTYTRPGMSLYSGLQRDYPSSTLQGRPAYHRKMMEDLDNFEKEQKSLERQRNMLDFVIDLGTDTQIHHLGKEYINRRESGQEDMAGESDVKLPKHIDTSKKIDDDQERDGRGLPGEAERGQVKQAAADNDMVDFEGDYSAQKMLLDKTLDDEDMVQLFKDAKEINARTGGKTLDEPIKLDLNTNRKSTYEKLLENEDFIRMLISIMQRCQPCFEQFYQTTVEMHRIEWCILIDNSGSMQRKSIQMNVALALTMEILRRMEQPFAVTRFGDRNSQQMLKMVTDHFTDVIGQKVIESFSYDQGTYIATAIANAAETVWPTSSSEEDEDPRCHRVMFLITDGITQERKRQDYSVICARRSMALVVLNLTNEAHREMLDMVQGLWDRVALNFQVLDVEQDFVTLPACISEMIKAVLNEYWKPTKKHDTKSSDLSQIGTDDWFSELRLDTNYDAVLENLGEQQISKPGLRREDFYECDYQQDAVPYSIQMTQMVTKSPECKEELAEKFIDSWHEAFTRLLASPEQITRSKTAAAAWMRAEDRLSVDIERMTEALEDFLPQNVSARKRPDIKGPSIHLPGFIKHLATKGAEKKIFASRKGGGKSEYSVAIVLDISVSMTHGRKQTCVLETVLLLIGALKQMNLENFTLLLFGDNFFPVKLADAMWEDVSIAAFISLMKQRNEPVTKDADALLLAERLLDRSDCRGAKKIIVLTDGYGSTGVRLAASLQKLEESGIDVLAIDVGVEPSFVKKCYNKWITAALPQLVPDALESVMDKVEISRLHEGNAAAAKDEGAAVAMLTGNQTAMEELLDNPERLFPELQKMLKAKKEFLKDKDGSGPSTFSVDICFVMDCTSSMDDLIEAATDQVQVKNTVSFVACRCIEVVLFRKYLSTSRGRSQIRILI